MPFDPCGWVVHSPTLPKRTRENRRRQAWDGNRFRASQEIDAQVRLLAQPGVAVPHASGNKRIMIARNDEHGASVSRTFQHRKSSFSLGARNAVIIEHVASNNNKVNPMFGGFFTEL